MARVYNFSAGPATLPYEVLKQAQEEMLDWGDSGMSIMEMSHRGKEFMSVYEKAESTLREIMSIPDDYKVLFLQGGASSQFAMVPMNLLRGREVADYIDTGAWSKKAIAEASRYCEVNTAASTSDSQYTTVPSQAGLQLNPDAGYVHYTPNETIGGVEFPYIPETGKVPLVADMSSVILSKPVEVEKFGLIYAGAQKNIGPAGLTLVIVKEELMGHPLDITPTMFNYKVQADNGSMYNTPPTFSLYLAGLVFEWIKDKGGLGAIDEINRRKAAKLYQAIDASGFYSNPVDIPCRSLMNVPFILANPDLDSLFLAEAKESGMVALKGHRSVGGMRASIYNAMPEDGVDALVKFMVDFEKNNT